MKKFFVAATLWPVTVFVGWVFTKLSERFEMVLDLDNLDFEDEGVPVRPLHAEPL